jgi:DNA-binding MarR family transcriptional regulator
MTKAARTAYLLRQAQLRTYAAMVERLGALGLTPVQYMVLSLSSREGGLSSADLARRTQITPQSMNEVIAALDRKGLIKRHEAPENRRILRVVLTKEGNRLLPECERQIDQLETELFRCFDRSELTAFRNLLSTFLESQRAGVHAATNEVAV